MVKDASDRVDPAHDERVPNPIADRMSKQCLAPFFSNRSKDKQHP